MGYLTASVSFRALGGTQATKKVNLKISIFSNSIESMFGGGFENVFWELVLEREHNFRQIESYFPILEKHSAPKQNKIWKW